MPTLQWIGKEAVVGYADKVPFRVLEKKYTFGDDANCRDVARRVPTSDTNKIIHGDNLEALKALLPEYEGRIKCIYIDPPYNTGNENWVYNDNVNSPRIRKWLGQVVGKEAEDLTRHDKWLCMMYPRLKLLQNLLSEDGVIFISIDDNEQANLKLICDEIFGAGNFVANVIWQKKYTIANDAKYFSCNHDHILCYAKFISQFTIGKLSRTVEMNSAYKNPDNHPKGPWKATPLHAKSGSANTANFSYTFKNGIVFKPPTGRFTAYSAETLKQLDEGNEIWFGTNGKSVPSRKTFLCDLKSNGVVPRTIITYDVGGHNHEADEEIKQILGSKIFTTPKPSKLISLLLTIANTDPDSIILDSFAGSGTTAHAVLNLNKADGGNRKFILVEMEDYAESITAERVKRVIDGYGDTEGTGGEFDFYELGEPVFDEDKNLNENIGEEKIREYIWFSETHIGLQAARLSNADEPSAIQDRYFLGKYNNCGYWFFYQKETETTLDDDFLKTMAVECEQYVIYADKCILPKDFMNEKNIVFKKIPRDIKKL